MKNVLLGIDIGTSACKVAAFDLEGKVLGESTKGYDVLYPQKDFVEQNPNHWWDAVCSAIKEILARGNISNCDIACVGIDGQSWSCLPLDKNGEALDNAIIWMDTRSDEIANNLSKDYGEKLFDISKNPIKPTYITSKILWLKENKPDIYKNTYKFMQSNAFIAYKLTGVFSQDKSQGYGFHFFDMDKLKYDEEILNAINLDITKFCHIYDCDEVIGEVTEKAAKECGLCVGTPVVAGGLDAACGALGSGVYKPGQTQEQGGQAGGMSICLSTAKADERLILSSHVVPNLWLLQGGTVGGGSLRWLAKQIGMTDFKEMDSLAEAVSAGSDGVIFLPYMAGERSPIWNNKAKGILYGLGYDKSRGHIIRAVLEGCAFALKHNLDVAEKAGALVDVMNAMGGAANSRLWTQIKADVTGKVINVPASETATTQGAAILAGIGCGLYKSYEQAVDTTIKIKRTHYPDENNFKIYKENYELYLDLYKNLEKTFK